MCQAVDQLLTALTSFLRKEHTPLPKVDISAFISSVLDNGAIAFGAFAFDAFAIGALVLVAGLLVRQVRNKGQSPLQMMQQMIAAARRRIIAATAGVKDIVECSVFAPARVAPGGRFKVQVHLHLNEDFPKVRLAAKRIDPTASRRASESLTSRIARGATVGLSLEGDDFITTEPERQLLWEGTPAIEVFEVKARNNLAVDSISGIVCVSVDDVPVGEVEFNLDVKLTASLRSAKRAKTRATKYKVAFVSYSREDFDAFKLIAHTLETAEYEVLTDATALKPGEEWPKALPALIDRADLFYLVWSQHAAKSKWVDKEARHAVRLHNRSAAHRPRICPTPVDDPYPSPPDYLGDFHFGSLFLNLRRARQVPLADGTT
jgi:hypothetical protein